MPRKTKSAGGNGRMLPATQAKRAVSPAPFRKRKSSAKANGRLPDDTQRCGAVALDTAAIIDQIRAWHRNRVFVMDKRKRDDLSLGSWLRSQLGWSRNIPKSEAEEISKRARDIISLGEKIVKAQNAGKTLPTVEDPAFAHLGDFVLAMIRAREPVDVQESKAEKQMERLAALLPVWPLFGQPIKGFGVRSLAVIVAEAGDISNYANPAKLWKRMGLAVMDGVRQGGLRKTASSEEWIAHGYNAKRRSFMFVIGDVLIKNQNEYREVYLARKEFERRKAEAAGLTVAPSAKIPAKRKHEFMSDGHIHRRAQRYMEKRLLKNLWRAWRSDTKFEGATRQPSPTASPSSAEMHL